MRVRVSVTWEPGSAPAASWRVLVDGLPPRSLQRLANGFPLPADAAELAALPAAVRALFEPSPLGLQRTFANILAGSPSPDELAAFGRYLFETLLGSTAWQALLARRPQGEPLELALSWAPEEWELSRLFWELLHDGQQFLAESLEPEVSFVRVVPVGPSPAATHLQLPLRVLFVVGSELSDAAIRPGAEFLGLLRRLESRQRAFSHRILLAASAEQLVDTARSYQPTVLHLTCHGEWGSIRLKPDANAPPADVRNGFQRWSAPALLSLLEGTGAPLPSLVVLNACDSASGRPVSLAQPDATPEPSFASELARLGIPLVVGMAGKVADHACRLFTRQLYESLLEASPGQAVDIALATASGRRAGLKLLNGRFDSSDWLFPQLLARSDVDTRVELSDVAEASLRHQVSRQFRMNLPFCDRLDAFRVFEHWLDSGDCLRSLLALVPPPLEREPLKYGATRLLNELAVQALHSGYVPVLLGFPDGSTEALPPLTLLKELRNALNAARRAWGLPAAQDSQITRLLQRKVDPAQALHPALEAELAGGELTDANVLRMALAIDFAALAHDAPQRRVLLLLDAIHTWAPSLSTLIRMLDEPLAFDGTSIPVAVSCRRSPDNAKVDTAIKSLLERQAVRRLDVGPFLADQEGLAYQQFVVLRQPSHVPDPNDSEAAALLEQLISRYVGGVPSRLHDNPTLEAVLDTLVLTRKLLPADDEAALQALLPQSPRRAAGDGT